MVSEPNELLNFFPEKILKFCPRCGSYGFSKQHDNSLKCPKCDFRYYINAAPAVAAIIVNLAGEILLTIRKHNPGKGTFDLPGGFVSPGEKAEEALVREIEEEVNLKISSFTYFGSFPNTYLYGGIVYFTTDLCFICQVEDFSQIKADDDVAGFQFFAPDQIKISEIGLTSIRVMIEEYLKTFTK
jgi:NAD+ diphosphatase